MTLQDRPAGVAAHGGQGGWASAIVVMPVLALIANIGIYILARNGVSVIIPIEVIAGFAYRLAPLNPIIEALILGFGLWWYAAVSGGGATIAAILIFVLRIVVAFIVGYALSVTTAMLSDAVLTSPASAYLPPFVQVAFSGAAVLVVLAYYAPSFRSWGAWIWTLLAWAGGTVFLFWLYRNSIIIASYPWLAQCVRALGFLVIGCYLRPARR